MGYGRGGGGGRQQYDNNLRGALFENNQKRRGKQDPDMQGSCEIDGVEYWMSAWWKTSDRVDGEFLSISLKPKDEGNGRNQNSGRGRAAPDGGRGRDASRGSDRSNDGRGDRRGQARGGDAGGFDEMDDDIPF